MSVSPQQVLTHILSHANAFLGDRGFSRSGLTFTRHNDECDEIIAFQISESSNAEVVLFTINIGLVYPALLDATATKPMDVDIWDAHLRQRIGHLLPCRRDHWWTLSAESDITSIEQETRSAIEAAIAYTSQYVKLSAVTALWQSGKSPGLTASQRDRLLTKAVTIQGHS